MSFTQDELEALNTILDHKTDHMLSEFERLFDQRIQNLRKEFEQQQERLVDSIERSFTAQLLAFEQLINQRFPALGRDEPQPSPVMYADLPQTSFEAIEVQTEIPWEDLIDLLNKALSEQFITFNTSLQARLRAMEREVSSQVQLLRDNLRKEQPKASSMKSTEAEMQDILTSISQLEHIVESMQVAMTANSTLLSNRLYHHQHLPRERAHPSHPLSPGELEHSKERDENLLPSPPAQIDD